MRILTKVFDCERVLIDVKNSQPLLIGKSSCFDLDNRTILNVLSKKFDSKILSLTNFYRQISDLVPFPDFQEFKQYFLKSNLFMFKGNLFWVDLEQQFILIQNLNLGLKRDKTKIQLDFKTNSDVEEILKQFELSRLFVQERIEKENLITVFLVFGDSQRDWLIVPLQLELSFYDNKPNRYWWANIIQLSKITDKNLIVKNIEIGNRVLVLTLISNNCTHIVELCGTHCLNDEEVSDKRHQDELFEQLKFDIKQFNNESKYNQIEIVDQLLFLNQDEVIEQQEQVNEENDDLFSDDDFFNDDNDDNLLGDFDDYTSNSISKPNETQEPAQFDDFWQEDNNDIFNDFTSNDQSNNIFDDFVDSTKEILEESHRTIKRKNSIKIEEIKSQIKDITNDYVILKSKEINEEDIKYLINANKKKFNTWKLITDNKEGRKVFNWENNVWKNLPDVSDQSFMKEMRLFIQQDSQHKVFLRGNFYYEVKNNKLSKLFFKDTNPDKIVNQLKEKTFLNGLSEDELLVYFINDYAQKKLKRNSLLIAQESCLRTKVDFILKGQTKDINELMKNFIAQNKLENNLQPLKEIVWQFLAQEKSLNDNPLYQRKIQREMLKNRIKTEDKLDPFAECFLQLKFNVIEIQEDPIADLFKFDLNLFDICLMKMSNCENFFINNLQKKKKSIEDDWQLFRSKYFVFWISQKERLYKLVWEMTNNIFQKTKSAETVMLWYIILQKQLLLAQLYEKDSGENPLMQSSGKKISARDAALKNKKTAAFLRRNFSDLKTKKKSVSIAFDKKRERKFEVAMGLFLLGEDYEGAIQIAIKDLRDIQLAVLLFRLFLKDKLSKQKGLIMLYKILLEPLLGSFDIDKICDTNQEFVKHLLTIEDPFLPAYFWIIMERNDLAISVLQSKIFSSINTHNIEQINKIDFQEKSLLNFVNNCESCIIFLELVANLPEFKLAFKHNKKIPSFEWEVNKKLKILSIYFPFSKQGLSIDVDNANSLLAIKTFWQLKNELSEEKLVTLLKKEKKIKLGLIWSFISFFKFCICLFKNSKEPLEDLFSFFFELSVTFFYIIPNKDNWKNIFYLWKETAIALLTTEFISLFALSVSLEIKICLNQTKIRILELAAELCNDNKVPLELAISKEFVFNQEEIIYQKSIEIYGGIWMQLDNFESIDVLLDLDNFKQNIKFIQNCVIDLSDRISNKKIIQSFQDHSLSSLGKSPQKQSNNFSVTEIGENNVLEQETNMIITKISETVLFYVLIVCIEFENWKLCEDILCSTKQTFGIKSQELTNLLLDLKLYDQNTNEYSVSGLFLLSVQLHYLEGLYNKWYSSENQNLGFLKEKLNFIILKKMKRCSQLLDFLTPTEQIRSLRDIRKFICNIEPSAKQEVTTSKRRDSIRKEINQILEFESDQELTSPTVFEFGELWSLEWKKSVFFNQWEIAKNNIGRARLISSRLRQWLRLEFHFRLLSIDNCLLSQDEQILKSKLLKKPIQLFKPVISNKMQFPNVLKNKKEKRDKLFLENDKRSNTQMYFLVENHFQKRGLMECLFRKNRKENGYNLSNSDNPSSFSHISSVVNEFDFNSGFSYQSGIILVLREFFKTHFSFDSSSFSRVFTSIHHEYIPFNQDFQIELSSVDNHFKDFNYENFSQHYSKGSIITDCWQKYLFEFIFNLIWEKRGFFTQRNISLTSSLDLVSFNKGNISLLSDDTQNNSFFGNKLYSSFLYDQISEFIWYNNSNFAPTIAENKTNNIQKSRSSFETSLIKKINLVNHCSDFAYSKIVEKVLDTQNHKLLDQSEISCIVKHPQLPIVYISYNKSISVLSCTTNALINEFDLQTESNISEIKSNNYGTKLLILNETRDLFILKINDFGRQLVELCSIKQKKIQDVTFLEGASQIVAVVNDGILILSLLTKKLDYLFKLSKKELGASLTGQRNWATKLGYRFSIVSENFKDKEQSSSQSDIVQSSSRSKIPELKKCFLVFSRVCQKLIICLEESRQVIFFDLKNNPHSTLLSKDVRLSHVIFFESKVKFTSHCMDSSQRFLYLSNRDGEVFKIDISLKKVVDQYQFIANPKKFRIKAMYKFGPFLIVMDKLAELVLINF